jgi:hypothetical protein
MSRRMMYPIIRAALRVRRASWGFYRPWRVGRVT